MSLTSTTANIGSFPTTFPALYLDPNEWESMPARLADPFLHALHEHNLATLAAWRSGGNTLASIHRAAASHDSNAVPRRTLKTVFQAALGAWYCARRPEDLTLATDCLRAACRSDQWRVKSGGGKSGGIHAADLATGELLHIVASGVDALWPHLDEALREECLDALVHKGLAAYLDGIAQHDWWVECDFNWNSALHGNAGIAALVIGHRDPELAARVLDQAIRGIRHMISAFQPGGGWIEGLMYLGTAVGHLTDFVIPLHRIMGDDLGLFANADFHKTIDFMIDFHGGDGNAYNISDINEGSPAGLVHHLWWAHQLNRPDWTADQQRKMAARFGRPGPTGGLFPDIQALWLALPDQPAKQRPIPRLAHYPGIDWLAWRGEKTWLAFRSGCNAGNHDNDDLGHFILGIGAERFLIDPGYGAIKASQHNCITVRRHEQTDGAIAHIERLEELPGGFYLDCNITDAFPNVLAHYHRHLLLVDDQHLLLIDDLVTRPAGCGPSPCRMRTDARGFFQTCYPARLTENGFAIDGQEHTLSIRFLSDIGNRLIEPWLFSHGTPDKPRTINRLQYDDLFYRPHSVQVTLLTFGNPEALLTHRPDGGLTITLAGQAFAFSPDADRILRLT